MEFLLNQRIFFCKIVLSRKTESNKYKRKNLMQKQRKMGKNKALPCDKYELALECVQNS